VRGAYYNENDPKAAAWLRELIRGSHIANGFVDERSIEDVKPNDLKMFTQCHFFAGIGGWSYALRLAGWPDDRPVWTGSCPCQPFSAAGKGAGFADERHLWPAWFHLVRSVRSQHIFGEQVANALPWLDLVCADLEGEDYTTGAAIVGAHSIGAPHIRQRLYWVTDAAAARFQGSPGRSSIESGLLRRVIAEDSKLGNSKLHGFDTQDQREVVGSKDARSGGRLLKPQGSNSSDWTCEWISCTDGKARPVEPGTFPLAHGIPARVGLLRGYGNAKEHKKE